MSAFTLLENEGASSSEIKPRVPNVVGEITKSSWLTLDWDEMFARYVILLTKFELEEVG